jgi:hypothetical protein
VNLQKPSKVDACKTTMMHHNLHKLPGMLGSLDVNQGAMEELSHCFERTVPRLREVCQYCTGICCGL